MSFKVGTTKVSTPGTATRIKNTEDKVKVIEVRSRKGNKRAMYLGGSDVSSTNGREINPGETFTPNFGGGSEVFNTLYIDAINAGDQLDWFAIIH